MLGLTNPRVASAPVDRSYYEPGHHRHDGPRVLDDEPDLVMVANGAPSRKRDKPFPWHQIRVCERDLLRDPRFSRHSGHYLYDALERTDVELCAFHDSAESGHMLGEFCTVEFDNGCLGCHVTGDTPPFIPVTDQIGMMSTDRWLGQLDRIVKRV